MATFTRPAPRSVTPSLRRCHSHATSSTATGTTRSLNQTLGEPFACAPQVPRLAKHVDRKPRSAGRGGTIALELAGTGRAPHAGGALGHYSVSSSAARARRPLLPGPVPSAEARDLEALRDHRGGRLSKSYASQVRAGKFTPRRIDMACLRRACGGGTASTYR